MMVNRSVNKLCGSEVRMRHVRPEVLVSEPNGRSCLTLEHKAKSAGYHFASIDEIHNADQ